MKVPSLVEEPCYKILHAYICSSNKLVFVIGTIDIACSD